MSVRWLRRTAIFLLGCSALLWVLSSCGFGFGLVRGTQGLVRVGIWNGQILLVDWVNMSSQLFTEGVDDAKFLKEFEWHLVAEWGDPRQLCIGPLDTSKFVHAVLGNLVAGAHWQDGGHGFRSVDIPLWIPLAILAAIVAALEYFARRRVRRARTTRCAACGYDLRATPKKCPECGLNASSSEGSSDAVAL